jgi:DNA-binding MarR family transcriptional regulator
MRLAVIDRPAADDAWNHRLSHLLWEVTSVVSLLTEAELADTPLTNPGIGILDIVATEPGITVAEIARRSPKTPQAVSQVAARLEKLGYLERRLAEGRGVALHITPAGEDARAAGNEREAEFDDKLRDALGADRYEQLRTLLEEARPIVRRMEPRDHGA